MAGESFAARSPYLWNVIGRGEGDTFERVADELAGVLQASGVDVSSVSVDELLYQKDIRGVVRATVTALVSNGDAGKARDALTALVDGHRRGRSTDVLSYASAAEVVYRVSGTDGIFAVSVPRSVLPR